MFEIKFACGNCGREWSQQFQPGDEVEQQHNGPWINSHECTHRMSCDKCYRVKCVHCASQSVRITGRKPIGLLDGAQAEGQDV